MAHAVECVACDARHPAVPGGVGLLQAALRHDALLRADEPARQRTRLWELHASTHCSVIGTCLTTAELRRVMGRYARHDVSHLSDHDLHAEAVTLCAQPDACARLLHKALDERHQGVIRRMARLSGEVAVLEAWREARLAGDIPGAYWALLTHPDTGQAGIRQAFGDVHMLSHLVGAANRADIRRLAALEEERAALLAVGERQQAGLREAVSARDATIRRLEALLAAPHAAVPAQEAAAGRDPACDLQARLSTQAGRLERLEARLAESTAAVEAWERRALLAEAECRTLARELALLERHEQDASTARPTALAGGRVLYVGGRPGCTGRMAAALAEAGGELLTHDGGRHDHPSLLAGLVSRSDRVLFPVDCISHDAALAVKRLCRQLGRPWAALRSSGLASFLAALDAPSAAVPVAIDADVPRGIPA